MKTVTKEEFTLFIQNYPGKLDVSVCGIFEPPLVLYYDFKNFAGWDAVVASRTKQDKPTDAVTYKISEVSQ